jgi:hypothetical protein
MKQLHEEELKHVARCAFRSVFPDESYEPQAIDYSTDNGRLVIATGNIGNLHITVEVQVMPIFSECKVCSFCKAPTGAYHKRPCQFAHQIVGQVPSPEVLIPFSEEK